MKKQIIQIYEMTYQKCTSESTSVLFTYNNYISRNFFVQMMRDDIDIELNSFKVHCLSDVKNDLFTLYEAIHKESHFHLDSMEKDFIINGQAKFDEQIFLSIIERNIFKII